MLKEDFALHNLINDEKHNFDDLSEKIVYYKTFLLDKLKVKKGDTVGFALVDLNLDYFGLFFACVELGLPIIVLDWGTKFTTDSLRIKNILPINHYFYNSELTLSVEFYSRVVENLIDIRNVKVTPNTSYKDFFLATPDDIIMICTSSGTTSTPRKITHTHNFFYDLTLRNRFMFGDSNSVIHTANFHHGSSMAVYFLPSLFACSNHYTYPHHGDDARDDQTKINNLVVQYRIENIQFSYPEITHFFLSDAVNRKLKYNNLNIFALSYIMTDWINFVKVTNAGKIYSIFGASEVSGPFLLSSVDKDTTDYNPKKFTYIDDFYDLTLVDCEKPDRKNLKVKYMDEFDLVLGDFFRETDDGLLHLGRSDLIRINDIPIMIDFFRNLPETLKRDIYVVWDDLNNKMCLAIWETETNKNIDEILKLVNDKIYEEYKTERIFIKPQDVKILKKTNYISGIKVDMELMREEFRKKVIQ